MNLEPVKHSGVSQKEKDKYRIVTHIYGIQKDGTDKPICWATMETQMQRTEVQILNTNAFKDRPGSPPNLTQQQDEISISVNYPATTVDKNFSHVIIHF